MKTRRRPRRVESWRRLFAYLFSYKSSSSAFIECLGIMRVGVYHGNKRQDMVPSIQNNYYDIVLCTYPTLAADFRRYTGSEKDSGKEKANKKAMKSKDVNGNWNDINEVILNIGCHSKESSLPLLLSSIAQQSRNGTGLVDRIQNFIDIVTQSDSHHGTMKLVPILLVSQNRIVGYGSTTTFLEIISRSMRRHSSRHSRSGCDRSSSGRNRRKRIIRSVSIWNLEAELRKSGVPIMESWSMTNFA